MFDVVLNMMHQKPGFIALISVLILSAITLAVGIGLLGRAITESQISMTQEYASRAQAGATACAEQGLQGLKNSLTYAGNQTLTLSDGTTCRILAVTGVGNTNRTVSATSTVSNVSRKVTVTITNVNPAMSISSWLDVINF